MQIEVNRLKFQICPFKHEPSNPKIEVLNPKLAAMNPKHEPPNPKFSVNDLNHERLNLKNWFVKQN